MAVCDQDHGGVAVPIAGPLAGASWSRSISFSVRYSLGRSSELGALRGTVRFTMVEGAGFPAAFCHGINLAWPSLSVKWAFFEQFVIDG